MNRRARLLAAALLATTRSALAEPTPSNLDDPPSVTQSASPSRDQEARREFELGKQAIASGRFDEARRHFQASLALVPRASVAFNLAVSYRGMGMPVEALEVLENLMQAKYGPVPADRMDQAQRLSNEARQAVGYVDVHASGAKVISVRVDGQPVAEIANERQRRLGVDPGVRVLTFSAAEHQSAERRVAVEPGRVVTVTLQLAPLPKPAPPTIVRERSVWASPWFWAAAGALVVGGVVTSYFAFRPTDAAPVRDPYFGVTTTSFRF